MDLLVLLAMVMTFGMLWVGYSLLSSQRSWIVPVILLVIVFLFDLIVAVLY